ncbi:uncharacterized protein LOC106350516 [Brassica napus]|uniref:uncharacterized protein LOC106350516 n=1 Tax=Brassica napus TaxID=3708 RepID=UPI002078F233|nr:uncharacterized protein LOC106350516 [Brassica napus]
MMEMATIKAIANRLGFLKILQFLATILVVECDHDDGVGQFSRNLTTMSFFPTKESICFCDVVTAKRFERMYVYKIPSLGSIDSTFHFKTIANLLLYFWKFTIFLREMLEGLRRSIQDINLGCNDAPFVLPREVVRQAEEENRFIIIGRPVMPRRQNLRAIVASMPRIWGLEGIVRGRIIEGRRFQFVFPSEEALETVMRRVPWAFAERMLVLQRWTPLMDLEMLNFIPFWIQIRGIPLQFMNREVIVHIAREMGQYIQMEYNEELGGRLEFVRVRLNWNVSHPLKFQRNFQFTPGVNTLLKFQYERLRGFCEVCGMITHDTGACVINNGGPAPDDGNDDSDGEEDMDVRAPNQGVIIEEVQEEEDRAEEDQDVDPVQEEYEHNAVTVETENVDEEVWNDPYRETLYSVDYYPVEMLNADSSIGRMNQKRKNWLQDADGNTLKFTNIEAGESSRGNESKRQRGVGETGDAENTDESQTEQRGAVGPEPPLPP